MSADVWIGDEGHNYTHNTSRLWHDHLQDGDLTGLSVLDGKTGAEAFRLMKDAFDKIHRTCINDWKLEDVGEPVFCRKYDSSNGWGSTVGGLIFLAKIMASCASHPRKKVRVSL